MNRVEDRDVISRVFGQLDGLIWVYVPRGLVKRLSDSVRAFITDTRRRDVDEVVYANYARNAS